MNVIDHWFIEIRIIASKTSVAKLLHPMIVEHLILE